MAHMASNNAKPIGVKKMRTATKQDFKVGTTLICKSSGVNFTIVRPEQDEVWVARCDGGDKCVFECEASCYFVDAQ